MTDETSGEGGGAGSRRKPSLLGNILKNTQATSVKYDATKPRSETLTCKTCGAARPDDATLETCDYCGNAFL
jgi:hypothetical protein